LAGPGSNTWASHWQGCLRSGRRSPGWASAISLAAQRAYLAHAAGSVAAPAEDTILHVLGVKASANDAALEITDAAMRVCGGAAFSKHLPIERAFRDARAGAVMAPTADALYDFYGRAVTGLPLF
jgi:alkylation response protein AidB-like acyl-CoA dehydrogenase